MARKRYDAETKARAIALVQTGDTIADAARKCGVSAATLRSWLHRDENLKPGASLQRSCNGATDATLSKKDEPPLQDLIAGFVRATFTMMTNQALVAGDPEYIKKQNPAELGVLSGILADKSVRVVEAFLRIGGQPIV